MPLPTSFPTLPQEEAGWELMAWETGPGREQGMEGCSAMSYACLHGAPKQRAPSATIIRGECGFGFGDSPPYQSTHFLSGSLGELFTQETLTNDSFEATSSSAKSTGGDAFEGLRATVNTIHHGSGSRPASKTIPFRKGTGAHRD